MVRSPTANVDSHTALFHSIQPPILLDHVSEQGQSGGLPAPAEQQLSQVLPQVEALAGFGGLPEPERQSLIECSASSR